MTNIMWRGDGPLMIGNQVGGATSCCCENPPPPCFGPLPSCAYQVEIIEPNELAIKSTPVICSTLLIPTQPMGWAYKEAFPPSLSLDLGTLVNHPTNQSQKLGPYGRAHATIRENLVVGNAHPGIIAWPRARLEWKHRGWFVAPDNANTFGLADAEVLVTVELDGCNNLLPGADDQLCVKVGLDIDVKAEGLQGAGTMPRQRYELRCRGAWAVPSICVSAPQKSCELIQPPVRYLSAPAEVTVTPQSTSLGEYFSSTEQFTNTNGSIFGSPVPFNQFFGSDIAQDIGHSIRDALSTTVRISMRNRCSDQACDCAYSVAGLKVVFEGKHFVMGTEDFISESGAYLETWTHDGLTTFRYRKSDLSNNETYLEKEIEVFCQTDSGDPPVDRWYAAYTNWCKDEANYASSYVEDYWIGHFLCEYAISCAPFAEDDVIPTGVPQDVERVEGWPFGSGCTPPANATITLSQDCG